MDARELLWAEAFGIYRGAVIMQGIAARYAQRQASSEKAMVYGSAMAPQAEIAWAFVREVMARSRSQAEKRVEGAGYMVARAGEGEDEKRARGKGYMLGYSAVARERSREQKEAEGKGYMIDPPPGKGKL